VPPRRRTDALPDARGIPLVLYADPLSAWCWVAERRVRAVAEELGDVFAPLRIEHFPLRRTPRALSGAERRALARAARRAAREAEGRGTSAELWLSPDAPLSSLPPLAALVAARPQGADREEALVRGVNVARNDVLLELAERAGLDLRRFAAALFAPATERRLREIVEDADDKGIAGAPALVVGDEWLVSGPRTPAEYRDVLRRYAAARPGLTLAVRSWHGVTGARATARRKSRRAGPARLARVLLS